MADENSAPEDKPSEPEAKGESKFEKVAETNKGLVGEVFGFLGENKKWWLLPIMGTFLVIGILVLLSTTAAAPFIYTFF
jgi:hypothetical protein